MPLLLKLGTTFAVLLLCIEVLNSFESAVEATDILGRYVFNHDGVQDELTIRQDGTYFHEWIQSGVERTQSSTWETLGISKSGFFSQCTNILFRSFETPDNLRNYWPTCISKTLLGSVTIAVDYDLGHYYHKT